MEFVKSFLSEFQVDSPFLLVKPLVKLLFTVAIIYLTYTFGKIWWAFRYFKRKNIPTPPFQFIFGHLLEMGKDKNESSVVQEWTKKYGKTFGYYEGHTPMIVTSDLDLIQEIFIKQFNNFSARRRGPLEDDDYEKGRPLIRAFKTAWKRQRLIMNPTFSTAKLKEMGPLITKCVDRLIEKMSQDEHLGEVNFHLYLKRFTMDTIWNCALGLDIDLQNDLDNIYYKKSESVILFTQNLNKLLIASTLFHEFDWFLKRLNWLFDNFAYLLGQDIKNPLRWLEAQIDSLLLKRFQSNINRRDYMQLLLECRTDGDITDDFEATDLTNIQYEKKLTNREVHRNLVMFMLAGYETTSTALAYSSYVLATNPEEQQKLRDEIESYYSKETGVTPDPENVKELTYLDNFCKEVLRVYPIARTIRRCVNKTTINGIEFEPDLCVRVDHLTIHYSEEIWGPVDPKVFYPPRHEVKRHPLAFLAFGLGPRNCIGMKFALVEMKLALVNLLKNFEFLPSENTPTHLELIEGIVRHPKNGISLKFKKREQIN